jgi:hypothetical protein
VDRSSDPVAMISAEAEFNEACLAYTKMTDMHMTLNHIEYTEDEPKEDNTIDIYSTWTA